MSVTDISCLQGRRVLIVEDELLIAMQLEMLLAEHGCLVVGPAASVRAAIDHIDRYQPDGVLLDGNLNGESSAPVAEKLRTNGIPFVLVTGYVSTALADPVLRTAPCVAKPFTGNEPIRVMIEQFGKRP